MADIQEVEFSIRLPVDTIGKAAKKMRVIADEAARAALARRFDLIAIDRFIADVNVGRIAGGALIAVSGSFAADIVQTCVVSRQPVATTITAAISERLGPECDGELEAVFEIDDEDPPVPFSDGSIELGELLAQCLAILINPYPRATGAALEFALEDEEGRIEPHGRRPFEALGALKKNLA
jgi:hypothetical protein